MRSSCGLKMSSGLSLDLHLLHTVRRPQDKGFVVAGSLVLAFVMETLCLRRFYRHCQVVLTGVSGVILQTGSSFQSYLGNVSLSIVALCHAKNLPE